MTKLNLFWKTKCVKLTLSIYNIYPSMSSVKLVEIYALLGGTKLTQNLRAGDQI